jgi:DNA-binding SARP family transcriptional activator/Tfp pilus assembly protein PilF
MTDVRPAADNQATGGRQSGVSSSERSVDSRWEDERVQFKVLGPLQVHTGGREVEVAAAKHRVVLAGLLLRANRVVPTEELTRLVWGDDLPGDARGTVQTYIRRLRHILGDGVIATKPGGYLLSITDDQLDLARFDRLLARAQQVADPAAEAALLAEALGLWQGLPLADVPSDVLHRDQVPALVERRLRVLERQIELDLRAGRHADLVPELSSLTAEHPHREGFWGQLMRALAGCGRQYEALEVYERLRASVVEQLGIDPSEQLQQLHRAVLRGELPAPDGQAGPAGRPVPAQLPPDVAGFTGRRAALHEIDTLLLDGGPATGMVSIEGPAGVGKTALALHWAHRVRGRFPDGQLYLNLHGWDARPPTPPAEALAALLAALGLPAEQQPPDVEQAAALYRTLLADRRILVVLDNASTADQVRPLLPGGSGCAVVVTSRSRLGGLAARDGARPLPLAALAADEATELLAAVLGPDPVAAAGPAAAELADLCGRLPLALRIAAANLLGDRRLRLADYVEQLHGSDRLAALGVTDDPHAGVTAAFDLSYRRLPAPARRMFRACALQPGSAFTAETAAWLIDDAPGEAERLLSTLVRNHLVDRCAPDRYSMHELLRGYASDLASREDTDADREAARDRVYRYYLQKANQAAGLLYPDALRLPTGARENGHRQWAPAATPEEALAWLDAELANLVAIARHTAAHGPHRIAWRLADALRLYLYTSAPTLTGGATVAQAALAAAEADSDRHAQAVAHLTSAAIHCRLGELSKAIGHNQRALALARDAQWLPGQCAASNNLGMAYLATGQLMAAADRFTEAHRLDQRIDPDHLGPAGTNLGVTCLAMGRLDEAADQADRALAASRRTGDLNSAAINQATLAAVDHARGRLDDAGRRFTAAIAGFQSVGNRIGESEAKRDLATVYRATGHRNAAYDLARDALELARAARSRRLEAACLATLASMYDQPDQALDCYRHAIALAEQAGDPAPHAGALIGLAAVHRLRGAQALARDHLERALALARDGGFGRLEAAALTALEELTPLPAT